MPHPGGGSPHSEGGILFLAERRAGVLAVPSRGGRVGVHGLQTIDAPPGGGVQLVIRPNVMAPVRRLLVGESGLRPPVSGTLTA